jgi:hypothetical protein
MDVRLLAQADRATAATPAINNARIDFVVKENVRKTLLRHSMMSAPLPDDFRCNQ